MQHISPFIFNGFRFLVGGLTLLPVIILRKKRDDNTTASIKQTLIIGCAAGLLIFFGATFQQLGLVHTSAGKAGFITGLYVIIVPILGVFWGDKAPICTWLGAVLALIGLYLLSATEGLNIASGDGMVLIGAFFWALHVQFIARFSTRIDPIQFSFVQSIFTSLKNFVVGFTREPFVSALVISAIMPTLDVGVISIGIAYNLQIVAQRNAKPSHAAIILGCILMLSGMRVS